MTGRGATQGTAEPTAEGPEKATIEGSTQDSFEADRKPEKQLKKDRKDASTSVEEATQAQEVSARGTETIETAPKQLPSTPEGVLSIAKTAPTVSTPEKKVHPSDKIVEDDVQRVGVVLPDKKKPTKIATTEHEPAKPEEKIEKRANTTSTVEPKKEKQARTGASTGAAQAHTVGTGDGAGNMTGTRRRKTNAPTNSSDRFGTTPTVQGESRKHTDKSRTETMDFYQRRRKKELEKCKLILTRNKQLVEVPMQRGELNDSVIEEQQYFHGYLWTGDLDRLIKEEGQFLVRKSDYNGAEVYVISVRAQDQIINLLIKQTTTKKLYWVMNYAFKSVVELVDYHYRNSEPVDEASVYLRIPVFRQDWQFSHEQIETAKTLGTGNFGTVHAGYLKRHPFDPPILVAVKTLTMGTDEELTAAQKNEFLREANLMLAVDHPNLVKLYGLAATRMPIQIVMELCNEGLLDRLKGHYFAFMFDRKEGLISVTDKARYVLDCARGLEYLHSCFIIHRDIAARNVLIRDGQAKISDFGLSIVGGLKKVKLSNMPTKWCAPETLAQGVYSFHTDVFSFGALIYEVFSFGRAPYEDYDLGKQAALRSFIINGGQASCTLRPIDPATPVWIKEMIDRCRQRDCYPRPLFPEIVRKLEAQLGSKATSVGFWVGVRERFQKFIVDMISIADFAAKEEEYIKADLDWLYLHTSYEELEDPEMQEEMRKRFPYLAENKHLFRRPGQVGDESRRAAAASATSAEQPQQQPDQQK